MIQLLNIYLELRHFTDVQTMNIHQKIVIFFFEKTVKTYFKAIILSLENTCKHTKTRFLMSPLRRIDCLGKFFEAVIY